VNNTDQKNSSATPNSAKGLSEGLFDVIVRLEKLPVAGRHLKIQLDNEQLQKLAAVVKVSSIENFSARLHVFNQKPGIGVSGNMLATVIQPCVITLAPVSQTIDLELQRSFVQKIKTTEEVSSTRPETYIDIESDDLPDEYEGFELDLTPFLLEVLALDINLYPRAPGAAMNAGQAGDDPAELSPFSALNDLKK